MLDIPSLPVSCRFEKNMKIYASIITKNEEERISYALESLTFAEKIILVDNSSTDSTIEIAKKYKNVEIHSVNIELPHSVADQRNVSIKFIPDDAWVYFSDADEIVTKDLACEILEIIAKGKFEALQIPRRNICLGKELRYGGWYPDYQLRLAKKSNIVQWVNAPLDLPPYICEGRHSYLLESKFGPHDKPLLKSGTKVGRLKNPYLHYNHRSIDAMLRKTPRFLKSEIDYLFAYESPKVPTSLQIFLSPIRFFVKNYFLKRGFLDGRVGLIESLYMSFSSFVFEAMKWEHTNKEKIESVYEQKNPSK